MELTYGVCQNHLKTWAMKKSEGFVIRLATQFLNCSGHLQLKVFLQYKCYWTSYNNCIKHLKIVYINVCYKKYMQLGATTLQLIVHINVYRWTKYLHGFAFIYWQMKQMIFVSN